MSGTGPWGGPPELSILSFAEADEVLGEAVAEDVDEGDALVVVGAGDDVVVVGEAIDVEVEAGVL